MPKGSEELTDARKKEIVDACAKLYSKASFRDITIRDIGEVTSFSRTSIYNYYETKEEIFLALLCREHLEWCDDLNEIFHRYEKPGAAKFAEALAITLEKRNCMLKLMSMNLYDMETNSRLENLVELKKAFGLALENVRRCLEKFFPAMKKADVDDFIYTLFPFMLGLYPYTHHTEKQMKAMELAGVESEQRSIRKMVMGLIMKLVAPFDGD